MQRGKHLYPEPVIEHWNIKSNNPYNLSFEVKEEKNRAGFAAFQVWKENDDKLKCVLFVKNDKFELDRIEQELCDTIADKAGFFQSFKLAKSIQKGAAVNGFVLSTQDPQMAKIMMYFVDRKLQFTSKQYECIEKMTSINPKQEIEQPRPGCTVL